MLTQGSYLFADATRKYIEAGKDRRERIDPRKLLAPGTDAIKATVKEKWNYLVLLEKLNKIRMRRECFCFGHSFFFIKKPDDKLPEVLCMKKVNGCKHQIGVVAIWHATY